MAAPARGPTRARGRTFMVPFPRVRDFADLNVMLETRCRERQGKTLRGYEAVIGVRLQADRAAFQDFPAVPFEACDKGLIYVTAH